MPFVADNSVVIAWFSRSQATLLALEHRNGLSAYDAAYLELAQRLRVPLAAKDSPLATAAKKLGLLGA